MSNQHFLYEPFNVKTHADNFIDYLEVIIRKDGTIEYAVPSHQQKLERIAKETYGEMIFNLMLDKVSYEVDYLQWLLDTTGCVSVWNTFCMKPTDGASLKQVESLELLKGTSYTRIPSLNLYRGEI